MKREYAIGEEIRIRCVEDDNSTEDICDSCCFAEMFGDCQLRCWKRRRSDGKNVHFEIVEG